MLVQASLIWRPVAGTVGPGNGEPRTNNVVRCGCMGLRTNTGKDCSFLDFPVAGALGSHDLVRTLRSPESFGLVKIRREAVFTWRDCVHPPKNVKDCKVRLDFWCVRQGAKHARIQFVCWTPRMVCGSGRVRFLS